MRWNFLWIMFVYECLYLSMCYSHQACCLLYYLREINSGIHMYQFTFKPLHFCFRMWFWFRISTKILADRRILRKKRHGSANLHIPIQAPQTRNQWKGNTAGKPSIKGCSSNLSAGLELRISLPVPAKHSLTCVNKAAEEIRNRRS